MADVDIAPELYKRIQERFQAGASADKKLRAIATKIKNGNAGQKDVAAYANMLGVHASNALKSVLRLSELPNETLYWNIAEKTIGELLFGTYASINKYAIQQMSIDDTIVNIGIKVLTGKNPQDRINQVLQFAVNSNTQGKLDNALTDPVITANRKFYDDFQKANAEARAEMGLDEVVIRVYDGKGLHDGKVPCQWCIERAGTWDYSEAKGRGVFERHPGCGCEITLITNGTRQRQTNWRINEWTVES